MGGGVERHIQPRQIHIPHLLGFMMEYLKRGLKIAIYSFGQGSLGVIRGCNMVNPPPKTQTLELFPTKDPGVVVHDRTGGTVSRKERSF